MTDLHTHILPGMDDGARDVQMSLRMLRLEATSGVSTVALTPHFYRDRENMEHFLQRRERAMVSLLEGLERLSEDERGKLPRMVLGAEVAWMPNMAGWPHLERLCYGDSRYLLLELPFLQPWTERMIHEIYNLMGQTGLVPVIAHIDRYLGVQKKALLESLFEMGLPIQISAEELLHPFRRKRALRLLAGRDAQFLISDCHNDTDRKPRLGEAVRVLQRKLGEAEANDILSQSDELLL